MTTYSFNFCVTGNSDTFRVNYNSEYDQGPITLHILLKNNIQQQYYEINIYYFYFLEIRFWFKLILFLNNFVYLKGAFRCWVTLFSSRWVSVIWQDIVLLRSVPAGLCNPVLFPSVPSNTGDIISCSAPSEGWDISRKISLLKNCTQNIIKIY